MDIRGISEYHSGFQFGVACAIINAIPNLENKTHDFQSGFTGGFAAAEHCMELRVCSRIGLKEFVLPRNRKKRFTHTEHLFRTENIDI